jgi:glycosyltransferase involved in cell wall biosynthesis
MNFQVTPKIFFYCNPIGPPEEPYYQDLAICIAEGLRQLNIPFYSDRNYWQLSPETGEYLFKNDSTIEPDACSVVVLNHQWFRADRKIPENLFHPDRQYVTVFLDGTDDVNPTYSFAPEFRQFDLILKTHYSNKSAYPSNFIPWAFGLSDRVLKQVVNVPDFASRDRHLLVNFRDRGLHSVRNVLPKQFFSPLEKVLPVNKNFEAYSSLPTDSDDYDILMWKQTGRRHYPNYYQRLLKSSACAAFGGYFLSPLPRNPSSFTTRALRKAIAKLGLTTHRVLQWDSWRFWESMAAGCVAFNLDFDKYGLEIPVMPKNWRHYIGIDIDNLEEAIDTIATKPELLEVISAQGRKWAIENYAPTPVAQRFIDLINTFANKNVTTTNDRLKTTIKI